MPESWLPVYSGVVPTFAATVTVTQSGSFLNTPTETIVLSNSLSSSGGGANTGVTTITFPAGLPSFDRVAFTLLGTVAESWLPGSLTNMIYTPQSAISQPQTDWTIGEAGYQMLGSGAPAGLGAYFQATSTTYADDWWAFSQFNQSVYTGPAGGNVNDMGLAEFPVPGPFGSWVNLGVNADAGMPLPIKVVGNGCPNPLALPVASIAPDYSAGPIGVPTSYSGSLTTTVTYSGLQLVVLLHLTNTQGHTSQPWTGPHVIGDAFRDVAAVVSVGSPNSDAPPTMPLYVGVNRSIQKNIGSGSGSQGGWGWYTLQRIDARSDWGMTILPSGRMAVYFDTFDAEGNATAKVRTSDDWAVAGSGATWATAQAVTPNRSQGLCSGRMMQQSFRCEVVG